MIMDMNGAIARLNGKKNKRHGDSENRQIVKIFSQKTFIPYPNPRGSPSPSGDF